MRLTALTGLGMHGPMRHELPFATPGQTIGLLGGSFDPAHGGHVHISREALKRFKLDQLWWLVSPGNPLKARGPAPLDLRIARAREMMQHPKVKVTDIEAVLGTRYTAETLDRLLSLYPGVNFIWLMGADNLATLHLWENWEKIMDQVPVGVIARPGQRLSARMSKAAERYAAYRIKGRVSHRLSRAKAPAWCFVNVPMSDASSTAIREKGDWRSSD